MQKGVIAGHPLEFDAEGRLQAWTPWTRALHLEMSFYQDCPLDHGYPRFVCETFLDGNWAPADRSDTIPATQNGMGIVSYLKYGELLGSQGSAFLRTARAMGDFLQKETLTPASGKYPSFTRSTGHRGQFPQHEDSGAQSDRPYETQPDKGGISGYALIRLFEETQEPRYLAQALHNARVLAANQNPGDEAQSPWPFRVDYRSGAGRGAISGNMTYILRLYDELLRLGYAEFGEPRRSLWQWIEGWQIPSAAHGGELFAQFFEDHDTPTNRSAWAPLNLARYLLEMKQALHPEWLDYSRILIEFVRRNFTHQEFGITVCHEQDEDAQAWGGVNATYGAVLALYARAAGGSAALAQEARSALNFTLHSIDDAGRPRDLFSNASPGGWQEDAHTDIIHNVVDALHAFPEWNDC